ncbi:MAG: cobalt ECF transporter T component CbiQ [Desulfuromonadaceae bacterium]|nr:cobalt ECF transporter T component CbiQ [Desulfuromonadaceae bacterium]MDD5107424.1 cobalt ECF transporter T component CbiQ [Desulfuromonadaceae bacterium]
MLTEQSAYTNRWRQVSPVAKGCFACSGIVAACAAGSPRAALLAALIISTVTIVGAGIPTIRYLRVAAPALTFLLASALSLLVSLDFDCTTGGMPFHLAKSEFPRVAAACSRSLACLAALLFLALTTPLSDTISLLRRCKVPDTLLDLMTLCYRTLFVLSEAVHETMVAQSARLGYATARLSIRSLGGLTANLTVQIWQRSQALHLAAEARGNDGTLRFLENRYDNSWQHAIIAAAAGVLLILFVVIL